MKAHLDDIDFEKARAYEAKTRHDVMAHIHAFGDVAPKAKPIIHLGATSCYVGDNTDLILLREGLQILLKKAVAVLAKLKAFALEWKDLPTLGYTHYQPAQVVTVGKRACLWMQDLVFDIEDLEAQIKRLRCRGEKGTTGTGASYQLNGAVAVGDTTIAVDTGSGTILAGDVVTINGNKYVVATALSSGSFTINAPGIVKAASDNAAVTVNATSTRNVGFTRNAILLSTRLPAAPSRDQAIDRQVVTDPVSGISFEIAEYPGYRMSTYELSACWGVTCIKPEHVATLLG